jgi:hypothetical protein
MEQDVFLALGSVLRFCELFIDMAERVLMDQVQEAPFLARLQSCWKVVKGFIKEQGKLNESLSKLS